MPIAYQLRSIAISPVLISHSVCAFLHDSVVFDMVHEHRRQKIRVPRGRDFAAILLLSGHLLVAAVSP
jgi:hypothetical protein